MTDDSTFLFLFSAPLYLIFSLAHRYIRLPPHLTYRITSLHRSYFILSLYSFSLPSPLLLLLNSLSLSELISLELVAVMSVTQALIQLHDSPQSFRKNLPTQLLGENIKSRVHICVCVSVSLKLVFNEHTPYPVKDLCCV